MRSRKSTSSPLLGTFIGLAWAKPDFVSKNKQNKTNQNKANKKVRKTGKA